MENEGASWSTNGIDQILKALKNAPTARVGILGSHDAREGAGTNASIGYKHEFGDPSGSPPCPIRSFLRVPIAEKMQEYLDRDKEFTPEALRQIILQGKLDQWITLFGALGEQIVFDAFNSGGFGQWKPSNMNFKKNHQTLIETQQLRNSITSDLKG